MKLIVALGNPGPKYAHTRHNAGWLALDEFINEQNIPGLKEKSRFKAEVGEWGTGDDKVILAKPQTFMNLSGQAVRALVDFYNIDPEDILVVYDELMQPFGALRLRKKGSSAGHNGVQSVISSVGEGFWRLRIGVHNERAEQMPTDAFVLSTFTPTELEQIPKINEAAVRLMRRFLDGKLEPETIRVAFN